ncbi:hypothetical protein NDU88_005469 [Pleurodeles waltl]|uniref:Secreted protein n=1 Tax=Pleurodeles waltl TaxID=8319 RepID=A0AAV7SM12_PLEWA|nr:hypothetical protein NDU88_005469 [Pleurodeles waltl]
MARQIAIIWWALTYVTCTEEEKKSSPSACLMHSPLGNARRWRNLPVYRPLVDLSTMEERHVILTYRLDRATTHELCAQLEADLMSPANPQGSPL